MKKLKSEIENGMCCKIQFQPCHQGVLFKSYLVFVIHGWTLCQNLIMSLRFLKDGALIEISYETQKRGVILASCIAVILKPFNAVHDSVDYTIVLLEIILIFFAFWQSECGPTDPSHRITLRLILQAIIARGGRFLEAPVIGSKGPASTGELVILSAGDQTLHEDCGTCFQAMGRKTLYLGLLCFLFVYIQIKQFPNL